jgi:hypothetical protein
MEIQGYENYLIYPDGRVFNKKYNRYLNPKPKITGYKCVNLNGDEFRVHRLVAIHYIPNPNKYDEVDHIDRNKLNNHVENLRWVNRSINSLNRGMSKNNTSKYKHIYFHKNRNTWSYMYKPLKIFKSFKTKREALCYKFIMILKHKLHSGFGAEVETDYTLPC